MDRTRFAIVGTGGRYVMFLKAVAQTFVDRCQLVALCDLNPGRLDVANARLREEFSHPPVATYLPDAFDRMIAEQRVQTVIVTSIDRTHHRYIIRAMELGCDVISEKPMTIDAEKCRAVLAAVARTGRRLRVTFNYRYAPRNSKVKELLMADVVGEVKSVHFEWLLDTNHGADYFRRWHRDKRNSGGLLVHKATHHFDLVNWWLDSAPAVVYADGGLVFYGRENAELRGVTSFYDRGTGRPATPRDPFALDLSRDANLKRIYLDNEVHDGYRRDQSVFGDGISIEDDMSVLVRYANGARMTYHLTAYSPWEGWRIAFNGTRGRLEYEVHEKSYVSGDAGDANRPDIRDAQTLDLEEPARILVRPHWGRPLEVPVVVAKGGHGGGDVRLLEDLFGDPPPDPLRRAADHLAGARSILTGIAANRSIATGLPVAVDELVPLPPGG
jgi:predicted dehydrogenase